MTGSQEARQAAVNRPSAGSTPARSACRKHRHRTSGEAYRQVQQLRRVGREGQERLRVYECECGYFHVTAH